MTNKSEKDLKQAEKQFDKFSEDVKNLTLDRMNEAPKEESEPQTKLSSREISKNGPLYLKPNRAISSKEKFNETHRSDYNYAMERVNFIAENNEIIGEGIELWTKPFPGMPVEYWSVPTNKPVNGPRHLAEQIKKCRYHRLIMEDKLVEYNSPNIGTMIADTTKQRLDAHPVDEKRSVFVGASSF